MDPPPPPHIAMFSTIGKGHLIPLIEFSRTLIRQHAASITVFLPDDGAPLQPVLNLFETLPGLNPTFLPRVTLPDIPAAAPVEDRNVLTVSQSIPALIDSLADLNRSPARVTAFIATLFCVFSIDAVEELGIPAYIFYTSGAFAVSFALHLPELDKSFTCDYRDLPEPLKLPGCVELAGSDFVDPVQDRRSRTYYGVLEICQKFVVADGIFINSFQELEPDTFKALEEAGRHVYPVGPLTRLSSGDDNSECIKWLDKQAEGSVLYVSFGSGGTLSSLQLKELATGLEMSEQRILFVVRKPNDKVRSGAYFSGMEEFDPSECLPPGFMERVEGKGFVQINWAPQVEILGHKAVGGFMTHCGWNSMMESIVQGVPMIAWPLFAEQRMNAVLLSQGLKVGFRVREDESGIVTGEEIAEMVRMVMEGEEGAEMRRQMGRLKEAAERAVEENGSSVKALGDMVKKWKIGRK